jgi:glycosyltransferase involved in cell wall biosynthesis
LIIAPVPPPYGGMALQAMLLQRMLREDGISADLLGHTQPFSPRLHFLERLPGVRTLLRALVFYVRLGRRLPDVDVVHILAASWFHFLLVVYPAVLMARAAGRRVILNYRAGNADRFLKYCGWLVKPVFRMATCNTTPSGFLAEVIHRRTGVPVSIVPNIVNFSIFRFRERREFQPKMLVTRHLETLYDVENVLRAYRETVREYPSASLWIAGTGSQEARLRELASAWELGNVRFLGYVDHKTLAGLYDECDILLNASRVDNFPGSLMEASASGLVVVSTNAGGIPYLYENGKSALLVEIGDWQALASAALRVMRDPDLARRLVAASLEICRRCEWDSVRRALYQVYGFQVESKGVTTNAYV